MGLSHDEQIHLRVNVIEIQQQYSWTCLFDAWKKAKHILPNWWIDGELP